MTVNPSQVSVKLFAPSIENCVPHRGGAGPPSDPVMITLLLQASVSGIEASQATNWPPLGKVLEPRLIGGRASTREVKAKRVAMTRRMLMMFKRVRDFEKLVVDG